MALGHLVSDALPFPPDNDPTLAEYAFPCDNQELERLDMQHAMQTMLMNDKLFWSPIGSSPQKILDLGTGTGRVINASHNTSPLLMICKGIWAIDVAEMYPSAQVRATKLRSAPSTDMTIGNWHGPQSCPTDLVSSQTCHLCMLHPQLGQRSFDKISQALSGNWL